LAQPFVARGTPLAPEQLATVTQALFALGHSVHVLNAAEQRRIVFQNGAYIHFELLPCGSDSLLVGVRRLLENDGIQLLVGAPADLAVAASINSIDVPSPAVQTVVARQIGRQQPAPGLAMCDTVDALPDNVRQTLQPLLALGYDTAAVDQLASGSRSSP
jgi:hypothetical protein